MHNERENSACASAEKDYWSLRNKSFCPYYLQNFSLH